MEHFVELDPDVTNIQFLNNINQYFEGVIESTLVLELHNTNRYNILKMIY